MVEALQLPNGRVLPTTCIKICLLYGASSLKLSLALQLNIIGGEAFEQPDKVYSFEKICALCLTGEKDNLQVWEYTHLPVL